MTAPSRRHRGPGDTAPGLGVCLTGVRTQPGRRGDRSRRVGHGGNGALALDKSGAERAAVAGSAGFLLKAPASGGYAQAGLARVSASPGERQLAVFVNDRPPGGGQPAELAIASTSTGTVRMVPALHLTVGEDSDWVRWLPGGTRLVVWPTATISSPPRPSRPARSASPAARTSTSRPSSSQRAVDDERRRPHQVHVSDDVRFSLRYRDDDHIARELGEPPAEFW